MLNTFRRIWKMAGKRRDEIKKSLLFSFLHAACGAFQLIAVVIAIQVLTGDKAAAAGIWQIALLTVLCIAGSYFTTYREQMHAFQGGFRMVADKRIGIADQLKRVPLGFFSDTSAGRISASLTTTLSNVESGAVTSLVMITSGLLGAAAFLICILFYEWRTGLIAAAGMICYLAVVGYQMKQSAKNAPPLQKAQNQLTEAAVTCLQGIKVTKAFSFQKGDEKLEEAIDGSEKANIRLTKTSMPSQYAGHLTIAVFEGIILLLAAFLFFNMKEISAAKAVVLIIFSFMVYASLNQAGSILSMIGMLDMGLNEVKEMESIEKLTCREPEKNPASNEIEFRDVSFSYGKNEVLHHVSACMAPRSLTAIVGPSGSGKTTLCQLIPRFRDVSEGAVLLGGADVRNIPQEELMKKVSMVFQKVYLFEDTILNNIRFGKPDATLEEVRQAARSARCDDFIMALPDGYDTRVEEGGNSLSGGEKQRLSIARAILKDAPIIILDEATSALDAENEHEILAAIDELTKNKTVIMIAHRIQTVEKADQILVLDQGKIVQEGTHETLKNSRGLYADFIRAREKAAGWEIKNQ